MARGQCGKTDRYGGEVGKVAVGAVDAGPAQIRAGMAWYFTRYAKELPPDRRQQYADTEAQAQAERRGLWADAEPVPPWDWRQRKDTGRVSAMDWLLPLNTLGRAPVADSNRASDRRL